MKNIITPLLVFLFCQFCFAQEVTIDSLNKLSKEYGCKNIKKSDSLSTLVLKKANPELHKKAIGFAYNNLGRNLLCQGKPNEAINIIKKSCSIYKVLNFKIDYAKALNNLAIGYRLNAKYNKAIEIVREQLKIGKDLKNDTIIAASYATLSGIYSNKIQVDSTAIYAEKALMLAKKNKLTDLIWKMNVALGAAFYNDGKQSKALEYYLDVLPILEKNKDFRNLGLVYNNIGGSYSVLKEFDKAKEAHEKSIKYGLQTNYNHLILVNYSSLAHLYSDMDEYKISNEYYYKTLDYIKKVNIPNIKADVLSNLVNNFYQTGDYKKAIKTGNEALTFIQENGFTAKEMDTHKFLYLTYKKIGNSKKALIHLEKFNKIKDEKLEKEKENVILDFEVKYETEKTKREKETAEQQVIITKLESQKNKNLFLGSLIIAALLGVSALFYFSRLKAKRKAELITTELKETQKRLALEKQYKDSELKALKAQMNPHFIFNALNSIQDYIVLNQKNLASDYLGKFADLIRNYLHFSDTGFISIPDEIHNLNLYLELEKLRFEEKLQYSFNVDDNVNSETIKIPTMLIQPYVENALKHGLLHRKDGRKLNISISKVSDKIIECVIEDNGVGREKSKEINAKKTLQHKSFASNATSQRLDLLNFGKESKIGVEIIDLKDDDKALGTRVILKIPVIK